MNWKSWIAALVVVVTAGGAILAGASVHSVSGAGTDVVVHTATPTATTQVAEPTATAVPASPPQSIVEPPAAGPDLSGAPAGISGGPGALPSAGDGTSTTGGNAAALLVVAAILFGAGASSLALRRRD
jgi:hypothetical protein